MNFDHLEINSWVGASPEAEHVYGTLRIEGLDHISVTRRLSASEAGKLNKLRRRQYPGMTDLMPYRERHIFDGFDSIDQLVEHAIPLWEKQESTKDILVIGSNSTIEPKEVIAVRGWGEDDAAELKIIREYTSQIREVERTLGDADPLWALREHLHAHFELVIEMIEESLKNGEVLNLKRSYTRIRR